MNIGSNPAISATGLLPSLDAFTSAAAEGADVAVVSLNGNSYSVVARGSTPGNRSVAWLKSDQPDTSTLFADALTRSFSQGIAAAVAKEFNLSASSGSSLSSRTVTRAVDMAETSRKALGGVDFLTAFSLSAVNRAPMYEAAARQAGVTELDMPQRRAVDSQMQTHFQAAQDTGLSPVSHDTATAWLVDALSQLR